MSRFGLAGATALALVATTSAAGASNNYDSPDSGVLQLGRGSAWVARADDPLATYFNPAGLTRQATGIHVGAHLMFLDRCFTRLGPDGKPVSPGGADIPGPGASGGPPGEVCADAPPFVNPQVAATIRLTDSLALGVAVLGPHGVGGVEWPETLPYSTRFGPAVQPAPNRYLLISADTVLLYPTVSIAYAVTPELSLGAGFLWGIADLEYSNFSEAVSPAPSAGKAPSDDFLAHKDIKATLTATDAFIPGFVLGALWSPNERVDVAGWFRWLDAVSSDADLYIQSLYWKDGGAKNDKPCATSPDAKCNITDPPDSEGHVRSPNVMEAKLGARYHHPRPGGKKPGWAGARPVRDSLSQDLFDVELDMTWAHNSAVDTIELRFRQNPEITVRGAEPGVVPANADVPHEWRDVVGLRLGGDFVAMPNLLALRAGGFVETKGQDERYLNLDFHPGSKVGLSGGGTVRLGPVDVSVAYQHTFYGDIDNGGKGAVRGLSGDKSPAIQPAQRTRQIVNGGRLSSSLNEVALGGTLRF